MRLIGKQPNAVPRVAIADSAPERSVILMVETATIVPTGDA